MVVFARGGHVLVIEFRGTDIALNGIFCADVLQILDPVFVTDFTYTTTILPVCGLLH